jgi:hypothetical protein
MAQPRQTIQRERFSLIPARLFFSLKYQQIMPPCSGKKSSAQKDIDRIDIMY